MTNCEEKKKDGTLMRYSQGKLVKPVNSRCEIGSYSVKGGRSSSPSGGEAYGWNLKLLWNSCYLLAGGNRTHFFLPLFVNCFFFFLSFSLSFHISYSLSQHTIDRSQRRTTHTMEASPGSAFSRFNFAFFFLLLGPNLLGIVQVRS